MRIERPQVRVVSNQSEEIGESKPLSDEAQKSFLYENYPDIYKQMYPDETIEKKTDVIGGSIPHQKRENQDIQQTDKIYKYNKYGSEQLDDQNTFSYNIQIKTDMNFNR